MKVKKWIGRVVLGALALSVIPYQISGDEKTGTVEIRSLLWALRKTPAGEGERKNHIVFAIPPSGLDYAEAVGADEDASPEEPDET